jgi:hypothetical protein
MKLLDFMIFDYTSYIDKNVIKIFDTHTKYKNKIYCCILKIMDNIVINGGFETGSFPPW